ncbi:MAG: DUF3887 domain-containing protein [Chloroflexota bacterium]
MKTKILSLLLVVFLLSSCAPKPVILTGADREAVLAFSESMTDNLLAGLTAGDYAVFSRDFDADMLKAMTSAQFDALKADRDEKVGTYISRTVTDVYQQDDFYVVVYTAKFEKEAEVLVRVVFRLADPHQISGLWFSK